MISPVALLAACLLALRWAGRGVPLRWSGTMWAICAAAVGTVLKFAADALVALERPLVGPLQSNNPVMMYPHVFSNPTRLGVLVVAVVVLTPCAEELYFRGLLYAWLRGRMGPATGTIVASVLFAAAHGNLGLMLPLTLVGAGLCILYQRSHSLWPPILAHAIINALSLAFALFGA